MSMSMRDLFSRQGIAGEVISLRHSLANHPEGLQMSLREAHRRLLTPARWGWLLARLPPTGDIDNRLRFW